jgi:hypothetical protein
MLADFGVFVVWLSSSLAVLLVAWAGYLLYQSSGQEALGPAAIRLSGAAVVWLIGQGIRFLCVGEQGR